MGLRSKLVTPILIGLGWTIFHIHLIGMTEDLTFKLVLILFFVLVISGMIIIGRMEHEGKKNL